jgi:dihydroorotate dehydrogenase (fumarate)
MATLSTILSGVPLRSYVLNASGPLDTTYDELVGIALSQSPAIMMKSCTINPRTGNEEPRYARLPHGSLQSMGLPNPGYKAYVDIADKLQEYGKPVIASIAGNSAEEYGIMMNAFQDSSVSMIEVNLSCPNIIGKSQTAYDYEATRRVVERMEGPKPIGLKLPPYFDMEQYDEIARVILDHHISFITCINSVGNTLVIDPVAERPVIKPKGGLGGLGGDYIKPIALANVRAFYERLEGEVAIMGVGGISKGMDAFEFLLAGADAVQVGTALEKEGTAIFSRVQRELEQILDEKGYADLSSVKGKLKPF